MRCSYCGSKSKPTDIVCKGCSAPVSAVNHASGWAVFFCVLSLLCSALSVYNLVLVVLGLVLILTMEYVNNVNFNWGRWNSCYGGENSADITEYNGRNSAHE